MLHSHAHRAVGIIFFLLIIYWHFVLQPFSYVSPPLIVNNEVTSNLNFKIVLFWTKWFSLTYPVSNVFKNCKNPNCKFTTDKTYVYQADAVVFHARDFDSWDTPAVRFPHQRYVFLIHESPILTYHFLHGTNSFFNWTMTYRRDSDIFHPYGTIVQKPESSRVIETEGKIGQKSKLLAWFVSHCHTSSKRENFVRELQHYLSVDIYGKCGKLQCSTNCSSLLEEEYKFYLSLENANCKDYVTEKFFNIVQLNVIPIVLKRSVMNGIAPNESFIAVDDFDNVKDFADFLLFLSGNATAFKDRFKWKTKYKVISGSDNTQGFCQLCANLHDNSLPKKTYLSVQKWWFDKGYCDK